jgi:hypothetical protein
MMTALVPFITTCQDFPLFSHSTRLQRNPQQPLPNRLITLELSKEVSNRDLDDDEMAIISLEKELVSTRTKNAKKIRMRGMNKKKYSLDLHECCTLAEQRYEELFVNTTSGGQQGSPQAQDRRTGSYSKFVLGTLKRRSLTHSHKNTPTHLSEMSSILQVKAKRQQFKRSIVRNTFSVERAKVKEPMVKRPKQFSPWEIEEKLPEGCPGIN